MRPLIQFFSKGAPRVILGAFFLCNSCKGDPEQETPAKPDDAPVEAVAPASPSAPKESEPIETPAEPVTKETPPAQPSDPSAETVRFMAYNLKNYLTMDVFLKGGVKEARPKDPKEVAAIIDIIVKQQPQILGLCEIGTKEDLADLQSRLKAAGLDLPHSHHAGGMDTTRHLGLLSALPITATNSQDHLPFKMNDEEFLMRRGILDVTIDLPNGPTHFIGLHLKSKRPSNTFDEAELRLNEARLAKAHCDAIIEEDPEARIVLYGDMNDTRKTPPLSIMMGRSNSNNYLEDAFVKDSRGELWTHYWSYQQQYSRFDFILLSKTIKPEIDWKKSYIADPPNWFEASDHRPVIVTFGK
ncbi:MAG: hypothetical protein QNL68_10880 [Akkermansiaceae bacterium]|jgi:endonuclease/exonuclease/phosphatase family metal-dependent hydrolase